MKKVLSAVLAVVVSVVSCVPLSGCSGSLIDTVLADLPVATDIAISVVSIVSPGNAAGGAGYVQQVTAYSGKASADLKLLESLITQYKSDLVAAPGSALAQMNAALNDCQANLASILQAVGVADPKVTAAVAAAVASVKLILSDVALLVQQNAPPAVTSQLFFGLGVPGVDFMAVDGKTGKTQPRAAAPHVHGSGKSARQIAREYNAKISADFPKARVKVAGWHFLGIPVPFTAVK
jgi:hypothetical protein